MLHLLLTVLAHWVASIGVSLVPWYGLVKCRRHPDENTENSYYNSTNFFAFLIVAVWVIRAVFDRLQVEGREVITVWTSLITVMCVGWIAVMFLEQRRLWKGGPEALMAKVGGPDAKHRDLWELCYVVGCRMRGKPSRWTKFFGHPCMAVSVVLMVLLLIALASVPKDHGWHS